MKVGDNVQILGLTSLATDTIKIITKIKTKYDENTGKPYKVICFGEWVFDGRTGDAISSPTMYYININ